MFVNDYHSTVILYCDRVVKEAKEAKKAVLYFVQDLGEL